VPEGAGAGAPAAGGSGSPRSVAGIQVLVGAHIHRRQERIDRAAVPAIESGRVVDHADAPTQIQRQFLLRIPVAVQIKHVCGEKAAEPGVNRGGAAPDSQVVIGRAEGVVLSVGVGDQKRFSDVRRQKNKPDTLLPPSPAASLVRALTWHSVCLVFTPRVIRLPQPVQQLQIVAVVTFRQASLNHRFRFCVIEQILPLELRVVVVPLDRHARNPTPSAAFVCEGQTEFKTSGSHPIVDAIVVCVEQWSEIRIPNWPGRYVDW